MNETATETTKRNPGSAAALSLLLPGLGQVYCGILVGGLGYMAAGTAILMVTMFFIGASGMSSWLWIGYGAGIALSIVAAVTAFRAARRTRPDYKLKEYNRWYVYALLVAIGTGGGAAYGLLIRERCAQAFVVPNNSMHPTIQKGDRLVAIKGQFHGRDPVHGEVVIFRNPEDRTRIFVKRVIGLPGDRIEQRDGRLHLNGEAVNLDPVQGDDRIFLEESGGTSHRIYDASDGKKGDFAEVTVPEHHCFVLGDNRESSLDSRNFGPLPFGSLEGRAAFLVWPGLDWSRFGKIE